MVPLIRAMLVEPILYTANAGSSSKKLGSKEEERCEKMGTVELGRVSLFCFVTFFEFKGGRDLSMCKLQ